MSEAQNIVEFPRNIYSVVMRESKYTTLTFPSTDKTNAIRFATQLMQATSKEGVAMREEMQSLLRTTAAVPVCVDIIDGGTQ